MAHDLNIENGRASMAYVRGEGAPWHALGQAVESAMTWEEAYVQGGLDWNVDRVKMQTVGEYRYAIPNRVALVRSDTKAVLGTVSSQYIPIQNHEAFGLLDSLVADAGLRYHTVGALGKGEIIWLLAKVPDPIVIKDVDVVEKYLLLTNQFNAKRAMRIIWTPTRVVCQNTLNRALQEGHSSGVAIRHRGDIAAQFKEARQILGLANRYFDSFEDSINKLANHYPKKTQLDKFFKTLYPDPKDKKDGTTSLGTKAQNTRDILFGLFENGIGNDMPEIRYSTWAAYNAVTEYVDRHRARKSGETTRQQDANSLKSSWLGSGAKIKESAYKGALAMAGVN
jgi:phage/plasmid-like protein (TIGR03299 family)